MHICMHGSIPPAVEDIRPMGYCNDSNKARPYVQLHTCIHAYIHTYIQIDKHTYIQIDIQTRIRAYINACIYYIHTYMHACMHTHQIAEKYSQFLPLLSAADDGMLHG